MERLQFFSSVVFHLVGLSKHGWLGSTTRVSALVGLGWGLRMCISSSAHLGGRNPSLLEVYQLASLDLSWLCYSCTSQIHLGVLWLYVVQLSFLGFFSWLYVPRSQEMSFFLCGICLQYLLMSSYIGSPFYMWVAVVGGVLWHILISVTFCEGVFVCPPLSFPTSFVQIADPESWIA